MALHACIVNWALNSTLKPVQVFGPVHVFHAVKTHILQEREAENAQVFGYGKILENFCTRRQVGLEKSQVQNVQAALLEDSSTAWGDLNRYRCTS